MLYLVALLAGFGGFAIGWCLGFALFAVAFEVLRVVDRDVVLDSTFALAAFRLPVGAIGFAVAAWLVWRWRQQPAWWQTLTVAILAGAGGAHLTNAASVGRLIYILTGRHSDLILYDFASAVLAWIAGAVLVVVAFDRSEPIPMRLLHGGLGLAGALALIFATVIADFRLGNRYPFLGQPRTALFEVRMPAGTREVPPAEAVRVTMRTGSSTVQAHNVVWLRRDGYVILSGRIDISERTRERVLTMSIPDRPELTFRMTLVSNPPVMYDYGPWLRVGADDSIFIRFLTRRTI